MSAVPIPMQNVPRTRMLIIVVLFAVITSCTNSGLTPFKSEQSNGSSEQIEQIVTDDKKNEVEYCVEKDTIILFPITIGNLDHYDPFSLIGDNTLKWGLINKAGETVANPQFDNVSSFSEGLACVEIGDKYGFIDKTGRYVINPQFDEASDFSDGLVAVKVGDRWGFIDKTGRYVVNPQFDDASNFSGGMAAVRIGNKWGFIDKAGEYVVNPQFETASAFSEGLAKASSGNKYGYIDKTGQYVVNPQFDDANDFSEGLAKVSISDKYGFIDKTGQYVVNPQFDDASNFSDGLSAVMVGDKYGFIDKTGKYVVNPQFDRARHFSEGLALVGVDDKCGFIDNKGQFVINPIYDWAGAFSNGLAQVTINGKYGYINRVGEIVIDLDYDYAGPFDNDRALAIKDGYMIWIDKEGKSIWQEQQWITHDKPNCVDIDQNSFDKATLNADYNHPCQEYSNTNDGFININQTPESNALILDTPTEAFDKTSTKTTPQSTNTETNISQATTQSITEYSGDIFQIVDQMPEFPGGDQKLTEFISNNIHYPQTARETGIQGRVFIGFVIEPDGSVSNVKLLRGIGGGCDEEAMRVIKSLPKWKPGKQRGQPVRVSYQAPVLFKLTN